MSLWWNAMPGMKPFCSCNWPIERQLIAGKWRLELYQYQKCVAETWKSISLLKHLKSPLSLAVGLWSCDSSVSGQMVTLWGPPRSQQLVRNPCHKEVHAATEICMPLAHFLWLPAALNYILLHYSGTSYKGRSTLWERDNLPIKDAILDPIL